MQSIKEYLPSVHRLFAGTTPSVFRILIAYEGFAALVRAQDVRSQIANRFKGEIEITGGSWNFALLGHTQLREQAAAEAAEADMIIIAASGQAGLPSHVATWIEGWSQARQDQQTALVASLERGQNASSDLAAELRDLAAKAGMDFFCNLDLPHQDAVPVFPEEKSPAIMARDFGINCGWQSWGINE